MKVKKKKCSNLLKKLSLNIILIKVLIIINNKKPNYDRLIIKHDKIFLILYKKLMLIIVINLIFIFTNKNVYRYDFNEKYQKIKILQ